MVGALEHEPVVAGEVGLALGGVDDHPVDGLVGRRRQLHRGREGRAALAHDARLAHALDDLLAGHRVGGQGRQHEGARVDGLGLVALLGRRGLAGHDEHEVGGDAAHHRSLHQLLDGAADGRMDGCGDEAGTLGQQLTLAHVGALLHQGIGGLAEMLSQRHVQFGRDGHDLEGQVLGEFLVLVGVHTAPEAPQSHTGLLLNWGRKPGWTTRET